MMDNVNKIYVNYMSTDNFEMQISDKIDKILSILGLAQAYVQLGLPNHANCIVLCVSIVPLFQQGLDHWVWIF